MEGGRRQRRGRSRSTFHRLDERVFLCCWQLLCCFQISTKEHKPVKLDDREDVNQKNRKTLDCLLLINVDQTTKKGQEEEEEKETYEELWPSYI